VQGYTEKGQEVVFILLDVANEESVNSLVKESVAKFGRIDAAVHCAGIVRSSQVWKRQSG
jgi:NAD(P)-dependent dehydrogenase (short-subunit alcohol dehydrogenase family)